MFNHYCYVKTLVTIFDVDFNYKKHTFRCERQFDNVIIKHRFRMNALSEIDHH